jgi:hypothetical protein
MTDKMKTDPTRGAEIGARCPTCEQRLDAESDRDTYHEALLESLPPDEPPPPSIVTSAPTPTPPRAHSGAWIMPPAQGTPKPPYAVLADGRVEPLTNCPGCDEMGLAAYAHYHVCPPVIPKDEDEPLSMSEVRERVSANVRHYLEKHPEEVEAVRATSPYEKHVEQLRERARALPEGHWGHRYPHIYVEEMADAYVWAKLVE